MAFFGSRKKRRFQVRLRLHELNSVPYVSGVLFAKARLLDGGSFSFKSERASVQNYKVVWEQDTTFECKITGCSLYGTLEPCRMRVSVRRESKGGRSFSKVGYADVDLAEFADSGQLGRETRFLLEGYSLKRRQDNSTLRLTVAMLLTQGDPVFKVPLRAADVDEQQLMGFEPKDSEAHDAEEEASESSGRVSSRPSEAADEYASDLNSLETTEVSTAAAARGHTRNPSNFSVISQHSSNFAAPGSIGRGHSRNSSLDSSVLHDIITRCSNSGSNLCDRQQADRMKKAGDTGSLESRIHQSRLDNDELVTSVLKKHQLDPDHPAAVVPSGPSELGSLHLSVARDGTAQLASLVRDSVAAPPPPPPPPSSSSSSSSAPGPT